MANLRSLVFSKHLLLIMALLFAIKIGYGNSGNFEVRKVVPVQDKEISALSFIGADEYQFDKGKVDFNKGWIGIFMENSVGEGIIVNMVVKGSPAEIAGLERGDTITAINGITITGRENGDTVRFKNIVESVGSENPVSLKVVRDGEVLTLRPKLFGKLIHDAVGIDNTKEKQNENNIIKMINGVRKGRDMSPTHSVFDDSVFNRTSLATLQRIGEEVFAREGYQATSHTNNFRLPLINYLLTHPFAIPDAARVLHDEVVKKNLKQTFNALFSLLGVNFLETKKKYSEFDIKTVIDGVVAAVLNFRDLQTGMLKELSERELNFLYDNAPNIFLTTDDMDTNDFLEFFNIASKVDTDKLMDSLGLIVSEIFSLLPDDIMINDINTEKLNLYLRGVAISKKEGQVCDVAEFAGDILFAQDTEIGTVVVGGPGVTYYYKDAAVIIDIGGDDIYFNNAGATRHDMPVSICIDLGGNDVYNAKDDFSHGAARFGVGILMDAAGDDQYVGKDFCQGFAFFGVGLVYDMGGDDQYNGQSMCQGGGAFGVGLLSDQSGHDKYISCRFSQGLGLTKGVGVLIDHEGNDQYIAGGKFEDFRNPGRSFQSFSQGFGIGIRPDETVIGASGGIGLLFDETGNDSYYGDYFGQGSSYYFSLGVLYDKDGNDQYHAGRYSQGTGVHSTIGVLMDDAGDDLYNAYFGVSQACGYDTAIGLIVDSAGNDYYKSGVMAQGVGSEKGLGLLLDLSGVDYYHANEGSQGYSYESVNEKFSGIGILGDIGGDKDIFSTNVQNNRLYYRGDAGILLNKGD